MTTEADIVYQSGDWWVERDKRAGQYVVVTLRGCAGVSDSAYPLTDDGLSLAKARVDYKSGKNRTGCEDCVK